MTIVYEITVVLVIHLKEQERVPMQKQYRLQNRADYTRVYRHGRSFANYQLVLYVLMQPKVKRFRMGVSVSKKIGNAVVRNRMRRVIKEVIRSQTNCIVDHVDLVFIVRKAAIKMDYQKLYKSVQHLLYKAQVIEK